MPAPVSTPSKAPATANKNESLFGHIKNAFIYTFAGLKAAWENELAFRGEIVVASVMVPISKMIAIAYLIHAASNTERINAQQRTVQ